MSDQQTEEERMKRLLRTLHSLATKIPVVSLKRAEDEYPSLNNYMSILLKSPNGTKAEEIAAIKWTLMGKIFQCNICGYDRKDKATMVVHHRVHTGERPYNCNRCRKTFNQIGNYNQHKRYCDKKKIAATEVIERFLKEQKCKETQAVREDKAGGKANAKFLVKVNNNRTRNTCKPEYINCPYCNKYFYNKGNLRRHLEKRVCSKKEYTKGEDGTYFYKCYICFEDYPTMNGIRQHLQNSHYEAQQYTCVCENCNRYFLNKGNLTRHMQACGRSVVTPRTEPDQEVPEIVENLIQNVTSSLEPTEA